MVKREGKYVGQDFPRAIRKSNVSRTTSTLVLAFSPTQVPPVVREK